MDLPLSLETLQLEDGTRVVVVGGDLDTHSAPSLTACIDGLLEQGARQIVVDVSGLRFMDSSGLVAFMTASSRLRRAAGDLRVAAPSESVQRLLSLTRMDKVFAVFPTREAAIVGEPLT